MNELLTNLTADMKSALKAGDKDRLGVIRLMVAGQESVARTARSIFPVAEKANDQATLDLLTRRLEVHEKTAWMLRSLLE